MVVEKVFKGNVKVRDELVFRQGGGADCIWTFKEEWVGEEYLFYLSAPEKGSKFWYAVTCGRSNGLEYATEDLLYLENMRKDCIAAQVRKISQSTEPLAVASGCYVQD